MSELILPSIVDESFENKILDISAEEYHARRDSVHSSSLVHMIKSPYTYRKMLQKPIKPTDVMEFGTLVHGVILEGSVFLSKYVVEPIFKGLTKDGVETTSANALSVKQAKAEWHASLPAGSVVVTESDRDELLSMIDSLFSHRFASEILKDGISEYRKQWRDPVTGLACVTSDDFVSFKNGWWADIKTTQDCRWENFRRTVEKLRYDLQAAMYLEGLSRLHEIKNITPVWIAIESNYPYEVKVHMVDDYYLQSGKSEFRRCLSDVKTCLKNDLWPQGQMVIESGNPSSFFRERYDLILNDR